MRFHVENRRKKILTSYLSVKTILYSERTVTKIVNQTLRIHKSYEYYLNIHFNVLLIENVLTIRI